MKKISVILLLVLFVVLLMLVTACDSNVPALNNYVVVDDIVYLSPGKEITTDSMVVEGEVEVNESQLTGESVPIRKQIGDTLYSGSFVVSGNCHCIVERVGKENAIEKLYQQ